MPRGNRAMHPDENHMKHATVLSYFVHERERENEGWSGDSAKRCRRCSWTTERRSSTRRQVDGRAAPRNTSNPIPASAAGPQVNYDPFVAVGCFISSVGDFDVLRSPMGTDSYWSSLCKSVAGKQLAAVHAVGDSRDLPVVFVFFRCCCLQCLPHAACQQPRSSGSRAHLRPADILLQHPGRLANSNAQSGLQPIALDIAVIKALGPGHWGEIWRTPAGAAEACRRQGPPPAYGASLFTAPQPAFSLPADRLGGAGWVVARHLASFLHHLHGANPPATKARMFEQIVLAIARSRPCGEAPTRPT